MSHKTIISLIALLAIAGTAMAALVPPSSLTAQFMGKTRNVQLSWAYPTDVSITGFAIERAYDDFVFTQIAQVSAQDRSFTDIKVRNPHNDSIWYRVRAINGTDYSDYSNLVSPTVFPAF